MLSIQVINIAVLATSSGMGGFLPNGLNGVINGTSASIGSVATLNSARENSYLHSHSSFTLVTVNTMYASGYLLC